jgi:hypothetical protein
MAMIYVNIVEGIKLLLFGYGTLIEMSISILFLLFGTQRTYLDLSILRVLIVFNAPLYCFSFQFFTPKISQLAAVKRTANARLADGESGRNSLLDQVAQQKATSS